ANYYVQKLYSNNKGTQVLNMLCQDKSISGQDGLYASAVFDKNTGDVILKIANTSDKVQTKDISLETSKKVGSKGTLTLLKGENLKSMNTLDNPKLVSPVDQSIDIKGKKISLKLDPYSFNVVRIKLL
ncbi:MAG TPA: alpha-L-arabinofuranosidase C-terminal domain-containing protein, partial [Bacteroidales bacterium]